MRGFSLVLVDFAVVARDIAVTLQQFDLGAPRISLAHDEAIGWMTSQDICRNIRLAVIQSSPDAFVRSELCTLLESAKSKVILLVENPDQAKASRFPCLTLPFFTEDLEALIEREFTLQSSGRSGGVP
ncbi:MAG: hypothetical protein JJU09_02385 [Rhodobacteraceae bacterium]|nr:hypothetical protein [Paracoccaceae bacterium]TVR48792.1 MAG: hypothetical protein EA386_03785 [Paracoccaceae bacterium]